jgi:hypothetical protein
MSPEWLLAITARFGFSVIMWICPKCGEKLEEQFGSCWRCSSLRPAEPAQEPASSGPGGDQPPGWKLSYRFFRGTLATWDDLFTKAAYFATEVGPERVLNISHSVDDADGVVTVWYWEPKEDAADATPSASETSSPSP